MIEEVGLEETRAKWKQLKAEMNNQFRRIEGISPEVAKEIMRKFEKATESIEVDLLYPERKKSKESSSWIWILVIAGIVLVGIIGLVWWRKKKK